MSNPFGNFCPDISILTFEDVKEYMDRLGKISPTPFDAMRFGTLAMKVDEVFNSPSDKAYIRECSRTKKISRSMTNAILTRKQSGYIPKPKPETSSSSKSADVGSLFNQQTWKDVPSPPRTNTDNDNDKDKEEQDMICGTCGKSDPQFKCGGCDEQSYCSRECQKNDWKSHKSACLQAKQDAIMHANLAEITKLQAKKKKQEQEDKDKGIKNETPLYTEEENAQAWQAGLAALNRRSQH